MLRCVSLIIAVAAFFGCAALADDSPQFRGTHRTGVFDETGLMKAWPEGGPPLSWVAKGVGAGFSSAAVRDGKIYVTGTLADQESFVFILDLDGKELARIPYGKESTAEMAPCARSTPTLDGDRLYFLASLGQATCIDHVKKEVVWQVNILDRFKGPNNEWHLSENLLVDGDRVIVTPGGPDASIAALNKMTGETLWTTKGLTDMASYVPPIIVTHNGRRILLTETSKVLVCCDAETGELLWTHDHPTQYDIHVCTPLYHDGCIYYVAGYKSGGGLLKLSDDATSVTQVWLDTELDCQHHGVMLVDGYLYGTSHHRGGGQMVCLEWATGKVMWTSKDIRQGNVVFADGMLYVYEGPKSGIVSLVKPSPAGLERTGTFTITEGEGNHWAHQTIANGKMYIRHGDALLCYDITQK